MKSKTTSCIVTEDKRGNKISVTFVEGVKKEVYMTTHATHEDMLKLLNEWPEDKKIFNDSLNGTIN